MGFAIEQGESISCGIKRIAVEQIDLALGHLTGSPNDINKSIHATRQSLKRIRALLVLVRNELGKKTFECEWTCYRSAGRMLAPARDATAVLEAFESLIARVPGELDAEALAPERRFLAERRETLLNMIEKERALARVSDLLTDARGRVESWPLKSSRFKGVRRGLRRSYRSGRESFQGVVWHPTPAKFHEWRRPVKLLWHQLQILTPVWPVVLHAHAEELHKLSDRLNENHDLDVLRQAALWSEFKAQPHDRQALVSAVDRRCRELEAQALPFGERLYCERARLFTKRVERYWRAWEQSNRIHETEPHATETIAVSASAKQGS